MYEGHESITVQVPRILNLNVGLLTVGRTTTVAVPNYTFNFNCIQNTMGESVYWYDELFDTSFPIVFVQRDSLSLLLAHSISLFIIFSNHSVIHSTNSYGVFLMGQAVLDTGEMVMSRQDKIFYSHWTETLVRKQNKQELQIGSALHYENPNFNSKQEEGKYWKHLFNILIVYVGWSLLETCSRYRY